MQVKASGQHLIVSIYFGSSWQGNILETTFIKFPTVDPGICSVFIFKRIAWD